MHGSARDLTGFLVRQAPRGPALDDVVAAADDALDALGFDAAVRAGQRVAIAVGSRGITDAARVVDTIAARCRARRAVPVVVPAMGSHGGATPAGQRRVLEVHGLTAAAHDAEVVDALDVVEVGTCVLGFPLLAARAALEADHVVLVNRVKPHTLFSGRVESGIAKMLLIGLGKHEGAVLAHAAVTEHGWEPVLHATVPALAHAYPLVGGLALVERSDERTARVAPVRPDHLLDDEAPLLADARSWMPRLPFDACDLLVLDRIGKDLSGAGLDTNVVGRKDAIHGGGHGGTSSAHGGPHVRVLAVRGLSEGSLGNAIGIGLAELCRRRVLDAADWHATRLNALTAGDLAAAMVPLAFDHDEPMVDAALPLLGLRGAAGARVVWARDTLHLGQVWVTDAHRVDLDGRDDLTIVGPSGPLPFDAAGDLPDLVPFA